MWCEHCRQDVPAIAAAEDARIICGRCQNTLEAKPEEPPSLRIDTLRLQEDLQTIDRIVAMMGRDAAPDKMLTPPSPSPLRESAPPRPPATPATPKKKIHGPQTPIFSWLATSLGSIMMVCGLVLLGWALFEPRPILTIVGQPLTALGLAAMLVGVVFQLDSVMQYNRRLHRHVQLVEEELHDLQATTRLANTTHASPSQNFYLHMAEGASPHVLLADVKGQLDLLATQMANQRQR
ncbi:hypothetical protein LOC68_24355 [Blastopirellula sp. JC732]|uniref:Uncharacterized protein n=1 Tax=Blastopirellula sediminis TaxID=2894196 RepID=A0A9X1SJ56_9BACT|nr:hypothetical protein [Blastopirellula sediminis]MCC9605159.1 hypothetical protein [Blastopirellula sediminis]MCC9631541.1 hypothetical protein [Blastopirellula sediminis]